MSQIFQVTAIGWLALGYGLLVRSMWKNFQLEKEFGEGAFTMIANGPFVTKVVAIVGGALISPIIALLLPLPVIEKAVNGFLHFIWPPPWLKKPVKGKVIAVITHQGTLIDSEPEHIMVEVTTEPKPLTKVEGIKSYTDDVAVVRFKAKVFSATQDKVQIFDKNGTIKWTDVRVGDEYWCHSCKELGNRLVGEGPEEDAA